MNRKAAQRVFVYGTLRKGFPLHSVLRKHGVRELREGSIRAKLFDLGEFPGAVISTGTTDRVEGEVYELLRPELQIRELDAAEDCDPTDEENSLFVRQQTEVRMKDGTRMLAWAYFLPHKPTKGREIQSGDYAISRR